MLMGANHSISISMELAGEKEGIATVLVTSEEKVLIKSISDTTI